MNNEQKKHVIVLYSGGLDSRLAVKLLKEQNYSVEALYLKLPFAPSSELDNFLENENVQLTIIDCTKGEMLKKYIDAVEHPKHGRGAGYNPCIDCKLFMYEYAKLYAEKHDIKYIATGEVLGQRPMSQNKDALDLMKRKINFNILRPLNDFGIRGRNRKEQIALANKYNIQFPGPAGGCLLCEKGLKKRFRILVENNLINEKTLPLINTGKHYFIDEKKWWIIVGRNEQENNIIEQFSRVITSGKGKPAVFFHSTDNNYWNELITKANKFQTAFQNKDKIFIHSIIKWKM
jgi:PP-loop superfamily ATP-utilizing enzyme